MLSWTNAQHENSQFLSSGLCVCLFITLSIIEKIKEILIAKYLRTSISYSTELRFKNNVEAWYVK